MTKTLATERPGDELTGLPTLTVPPETLGRIRSGSVVQEGSSVVVALTVVGSRYRRIRLRLEKPAAKELVTQLRRVLGS